MQVSKRLITEQAK